MEFVADQTESDLACCAVWCAGERSRREASVSGDAVEEAADDEDEDEDDNDNDTENAETAPRAVLPQLLVVSLSMEGIRRSAVPLAGSRLRAFEQAGTKKL